MMAQGESYLTGYTTVGNPTIVNGIMTPSADSWITSPSFDPADKPWKLVFKIKRKSVSSGEWQNIISSNAVMLQADYLNVKLYLRSKNSSSFDICNGSKSREIREDDSVKWVKVEFDGTKYYYGTSNDGETYSNVTVASSLFVKNGIIRFGQKVSNTSAVSAEYDLNNTAIWIDGKLWWKAIA